MLVFVMVEFIVEFMMVGFEILVKKKLDDVMFDIFLYGNLFNLVFVIYILGCLKKKYIGLFIM